MILNDDIYPTKRKKDSRLVSTQIKSLMSLRRNLNLPGCGLISYLMNISDTLSHSAN